VAANSPLHTPFCELIGIQHPILNVGFGLGAGPALAAAVSNAGGCGVLGFSGAPPEHIARLVEATRELTDRPFGVNMIIAGLEDATAADGIRTRVRAMIAQRVAVLVLFWGDPSEFVAPAHAVDTRVLVQVGSVDEARAAARAGVDAIIAQGLESGGHVRGRVALATLLPAVVDAVKPLPVLASGGIADGRGLAAALTLGAQGVSLGTRFVASTEARILDEYKRRVVEARAEDAVYYEDLYDEGWSDAPHRTLRTRAVDEWEAAGRPRSGSRPGQGTSIGIDHRPWGDVEIKRYAPFMVSSKFEGASEYAPLWAGESCEFVHEIKPAGEIVRDLVREAGQVLAAR
jgi:NAD(P)H-dependent flavin oxidoreductase YrpB (nitropropane dioxygenase family)